MPETELAFVTVPLGGLGGRYSVLVDTAEASRAVGYTAKETRGRVYAARADYSTGRRRTVTLAHAILACPYNTKVRYRNGNTLDLRRANLGLPHGTYRNANPTLPWRAQIEINGVNHHLGAFKTRERASTVYRAALAVAGQYRERRFGVEAVRGALRVIVDLLDARAATRSRLRPLDPTARALDRLYHEMRRRVRGQIAASLPWLQPEDLDDLVAETFCRAVELARLGELPSELLVSAAAREAINRYRERVRHERRLYSPLPLETLELVRPG